MENTVEYERPNTVSGLVAKRTELTGLRTKLQKEIKHINANIAHLEAAIKLFDLESELNLPKREATPRGSVKRVTLEVFREANEPITSRQVVERWADKMGDTLDREGYTAQRKRISPCIRTCADQGLIEDKGWTPSLHGEGPFKLWGLKKGDQ